MTDALTHTTTYAYDGMGRVTGDTLPSASSSPHESYTYDAAGNLRTSTDGLSHTTTFAYDAVGNVYSVTNPHRDDVACFAAMNAAPSCPTGWSM